MLGQGEVGSFWGGDTSAFRPHPSDAKTRVRQDIAQKMKKEQVTAIS
jgi:hypothetical protein